MGGSAFAQAAAPDQPTLRTPRMTPAEYAHLKAAYLSRLQEYFADKPVSVLIEAPQKTDYGDIDFLVSSEEHADFVDLARKVGAAGVICSSGGNHQRCSIAVPKDGSESLRGAVIYKSAHSNNPRKAQPYAHLSAEEYAQIDIEVVSPEDFQWHNFYSSYGDLGGLLGTIVRNLGFTVSDKGLALRLKELDEAKKLRIEQIADKDGMLLLSNDPDCIMEFVGLSAERYAQGFTTVESFYEWMAECRLISMRSIRKKRNISRDRQKETKRSMYSTFFEEWLPNKYDVGEEQPDQDDEARDSNDQWVSAKDGKPLDREPLRDEAVHFFGKKTEFSSMHTTLKLSLCNLTAERLLKPLVAKHSNTKDKKLTEIVRAFRRWVGFDDGRRPYILKTPHTDLDSQLYWLLKSHEDLVLRDPDMVDKWVAEHWEELKALERQRVKVLRGEDQ